MLISPALRHCHRVLTATGLLTFLLAPLPAQTTRYWTGPSPSDPGRTFNWSDGYNWGAPPAPANDGTVTVVFFNGQFIDVNTFRSASSVDAPWSIAGLVFASGALKTFEISGHELTVGSGAITNNSDRSHVIGNAILLGTTQTWNTTGGGAMTFYGQIDTAGRPLTLATAAGDIGLNGPIIGSGSLVKTGASTLWLMGANTFTGGTTITGGTVVLGSAASFGTGSITLDGGRLRWLGNSADVSAQLNAIGSAGAAFDTNGNNVTFASALTGSGAITKGGAGTLALAGNNTFAGGLTVTGGTVEFSTLANLGPVAVTLDGGGLRWASGTTVDASSHLAAFGAGGATFDTNGNDVTFITLLSGSGGLDKSGAGTLTLAVANTFTGPTTISAGTLALAHGAALQNSTLNYTAGSGTLSFGSLTSATLGGLTGDKDLALGAVALTIGGNNADLVYSGVLSGSGSLTKTGTGTLTLSGTNTYSGGTTVAGGLVGLLGNFGTGTVTLNGGGLLWPSDSPVDVTALAQFNRTLGAGGGTFDTNGNNVTFASALSGGGLTKAGAGTLTLIASNTYGATTVSGGTLQVGTGGTSGTLGTGDLTIAAGATVALDRSDALALGGVINGAGSLVKSGAGTLTLSGPIGDFSGDTTINEGTLHVTGGFSTGGLTLAAGTDVTGAGTLALGTGGLVLNGDTTIATNLQLTAAGSQTWWVGGNSLTVTGNISGGVNSAATLTLTGPNEGTTLTFSGQSTFYYYTTNIQRAFVLALGSSAVWTPDDSVVSGPLGTGQTLINSDNTRIRSTDTTPRTAGYTTIRARSVLLGDSDPARNGALDFPYLYLTPYSSAGPNNFTLQVDSPVTISRGLFGTGFGGPGGSFPRLTKTGAGTLTLEGFTGISGGLIVNEGTVASSNASGLALGFPTITLNGGAFRALASYAIPRPTTLGAGGGTLDTPSAVTLTWNGAISGSGALTKTGAGTLTLTGANSYGGGTTIETGTLLANNSAGSATGTGAVTVNSGATLGGSGSIGGLATFASGAHLAPGNSPGTLTFTNGLTLNAGAVLDFELGASASDLIRVAGGTLTGPSSGTVTLNLLDAGDFTAASYTLFDFSTGGTTLSNFDLSDFSFGTTIAGYSYSLAFVGSTLELTASAIPEPSTYAALLGAAALVFAAWRRHSWSVKSR